MSRKFYKLKELAELYKISVKTLKSRLDPIRDELNTIGFSEDNETVRYQINKILYSPKQVDLIFRFLGKPDIPQPEIKK